MGGLNVATIRCVGLAVLILGTAVAEDGVAQVEHTKAVERLWAVVLDFGKSIPRQPFAQTIFDYCTETADHLPRNSREEDAHLTREMASQDIFERVPRAESFPRSVIG